MDRKNVLHLHTLSVTRVPPDGMTMNFRFGGSISRPPEYPAVFSSPFSRDYDRSWLKFSWHADPKKNDSGTLSIRFCGLFPDAIMRVHRVDPLLLEQAMTFFGLKMGDGEEPLSSLSPIGNILHIGEPVPYAEKAGWDIDVRPSYV